MREHQRAQRRDVAVVRGRGAQLVELLERLVEPLLDEQLADRGDTRRGDAEHGRGDERPVPRGRWFLLDHPADRAHRIRQNAP